MSDNLHENNQDVINENDIQETQKDIENDVKQEDTENTAQKTFSENLSEDLMNGLHSVLYKNINNVTINDIRIRDAFTHFLKEVECGGSFRLIDIINASESVIKGCEPNENAGNLIYSYEHGSLGNKGIGAKLLKQSIAGIYSLFSLHNGVSLDLDAVGSSIPAAEAKRYLILQPKKVKKFLDIAHSSGLNPVKAGEMISTDKVLLTRNNSVIASVDKTGINSNSTVAVTLGSEHFNEFLSGYNAVCSFVLCGCVAANNLIRLGLKGDISAVCARVLGIYGALTYLKNVPVRIVFTPETTVSVAVARPLANDGDYLYLLKLRNAPDGTPDKAHYGQLYYYLSEKKRMGIIKDVLPVRENIQRVINRLCNERLEYVPLANVPENCFGVIVSVGRGESVNGVKLGYFKYTV